MAKSLAKVFPVEVMIYLLMCAKCFQLCVDFSRGGFPPFSQVEFFLHSSVSFARKKAYLSVVNCLCCLFLRFRPGEGAPSGVKWPIVVMKYYCFTLSNKS